MSSYLLISLGERFAKNADRVSIRKGGIHRRSQKSFLASPLRLICCSANDDEGGSQSKSRARPLARGCSHPTSRRRRCADSRVEGVHLRHGPAHLKLGCLGAASDSRADDHWP